MKKFTLLVASFIMMTMVAHTQVERNLVVVEITTSTYCTYCPGAMMGLDDLYANGKSVAGIEHHNSWQGPDPFVTVASQARSVYYNPGGNPGAYFDGQNPVIGGNHTTSMYPSYLPKYNAAIAKPSPVQIDYTVAHTGQQFVFDFVITKVATLTNNQPVFHFVVTQSNIPYSWQGQNHLEFLNRLMVPNQNGTPLDFSSSNTQTVHIVANIDPLWTMENLEFVGFVQDPGTKEIHNGMRPATPDFATANGVTNVCMNSTLDFVNQSVGRPNDAEWFFPGGTPSSSTEYDGQTVLYNTPGTYDVQLVTRVGSHFDTITKHNYVTIRPGAVCTAPTGALKICNNNLNQTTTYTTSSPAAVSYEWDIYPAAAGTLTPNGEACAVHWTNGWYGTASLRARGTNDCGLGDWSEYVDILATSCVGVDKTETSTPVSIYPNPAAANMNVTINTGTSEVLKVKMINSLGNVVYQEMVSTSGKINHVINVAKLAEGFYFLNVEGKNLSYSQKVTVQH